MDTTTIPDRDMHSDIVQYTNCPYLSRVMSNPKFLTRTSDIGLLIACGYYDMIWADISDHRIRFNQQVNETVFLDRGRVSFRVGYPGASILTRYWEQFSEVLNDETDMKYMDKIPGIPYDRLYFIRDVFTGDFQSAFQHLRNFVHEMHYSKDDLERRFNDLVAHTVADVNMTRPDEKQLEYYGSWQQYLSPRSDNKVTEYIADQHWAMMQHKHRKWMQAVVHYMCQ